MALQDRTSPSPQAPPPRVLVVMGPAGAGKSTVGLLLARRLGWDFLEADTLHSPEAVARMAHGHGLTDAERAPWLARVRAHIEAALAEGAPLVVACSALRARYRATLRVDARVRFVYLDVSAGVLAARLQARTAHFAGVSLLPSQLATLEPPRSALRIDAEAPPEAVVARIVERLGLRPGG